MALRTLSRATFRVMKQAYRMWLGEMVVTVNTPPNQSAAAQIPVSGTVSARRVPQLRVKLLAPNGAVVRDQMVSVAGNNVWSGALIAYPTAATGYRVRAGTEAQPSTFVQSPVFNLT